MRRSSGYWKTGRQRQEWEQRESGYSACLGGRGYTVKQGSDTDMNIAWHGITLAGLMTLFTTADAAFDGDKSLLCASHSVNEWHARPAQAAGRHLV